MSFLSEPLKGIIRIIALICRRGFSLHPRSLHISCYLCEQLKDAWININPAAMGEQCPL